MPKRNGIQRLAAPPSLSPAAARKFPAELNFGASGAEPKTRTRIWVAPQQLADAGRFSEAAAICEAYLLQYGVSAQAYYLLGLARDAVGAASQAGEFTAAHFIWIPATTRLLSNGLRCPRRAAIPHVRGFYKRAPSEPNQPSWKVNLWIRAIQLPMT